MPNVCVFETFECVPGNGKKYGYGRATLRARSRVESDSIQPLASSQVIFLCIALDRTNANLVVLVRIELQ